METIKTLAEKAKITPAALYHRMKKLGIEGRAERTFTKEDADAILNYQPGKPGRKPNV